ncbi:Tetratricopeptide repeat-containing protein [Streptomyces zhaozhouensis]|uniref:Tetratricopeptide repeat-containing protein n=1 Tax=Streptomyces zhaozhouensis TaxID=1300267 RepID=A0A286DQ30_9ACTN|nr:tetratricopeptide repeat protein [Streptomyces zhaozhouensis]SOD60733.1 Tetratricopeptide repeat-containing protein [Streptomyces zhaozhouensis]
MTTAPGAVAVSEATLGPGHPTTGACLSNLATTHWALGRRVEALAMAERWVAVLEATLGPDHPDTVLRLRNVSLYRRLLDEEPA